MTAAKGGYAALGTNGFLAKVVGSFASDRGAEYALTILLSF
jgi:hypothetical protein